MRSVTLAKLLEGLKPSSRRGGTFVLMLLVCLGPIRLRRLGAEAAHRAAPPTKARPAPWPTGAVLLPFEDLEGAVLVRARVWGASQASGQDSTRDARALRDTSGLFVLDTGSGYVVLDFELAHRLGLAGEDTLATGVAGVGLSARAIPKLQLGAYVAQELSPVLLFDAEIVRRAIDRTILGLLGRQVFGTHALVIDYGRDSLGIAASRAPSVPGEQRVRCEQIGDGKLLLEASVGNGPSSDFILDTGATKCVLFERRLDRVAPGNERWPTLRGLYAPTVGGEEAMRLMRVPSLRLGRSGPVVRNLDLGVVAGPLGEQLSQVTGRDVAGIIGYSFLKRFRLTIDYGTSELRFLPVPNYSEPRPHEFSHVGVQIARTHRGIEISAIADPSPAKEAGVRVGDLLVQVDSLQAKHNDLLGLSQAMEGLPGTWVRLKLLRDGQLLGFALRRKQLL